MKILQKKNRFVSIVVLLLFILSFLCADMSLTEGSPFNIALEEAAEVKLISDLEIGEKVVDNSWEWEFRTGGAYSDEGESKPVTWIVVAKDHYAGIASHVTLISEEIIGKYAFDDSTNRGSDNGSNHWGDSGTDNATIGIRPFLNDIFFSNMSLSFRKNILTTDLPNKAWDTGNAYSTEDKIFLPSQTELGGGSALTYEIGQDWGYYMSDAQRISRLGGDDWFYWTRSPDTMFPAWNYILRNINIDGTLTYFAANNNSIGVRPVLNLSSDVSVYVTPDGEGNYVISSPSENETAYLDDLKIGDKVVDSSWDWEFRGGKNYSGQGETKPVTWIVVAKDHYGSNSGITLLSEEIIGKSLFDNSSDRGYRLSSNHWGDSGSTDASFGIRKFLNGSSYDYENGYADAYEGALYSNGDNNAYDITFYDAFSNEFKSFIIPANVPCRENDGTMVVESPENPYNGEEYISVDKVFLPSQIEVNGGINFITKHSDEAVWPYFKNAGSAERKANLSGKGSWYWLRSVTYDSALRLRAVDSDGQTAAETFSTGSQSGNEPDVGIRAALNLSPRVPVSLVPNEEGVYAIRPFTVASLEIGDRVVDKSWDWEFRTGINYNYQEGDMTKIVTWIVVAKDHYGPNSGITLLSEEIIGKSFFDNSSDRGSDQGSNHWGDSGSTNATAGIRKFLNGSSYNYIAGYGGSYIGAPAAEGDDNNYIITFYDAFSDNFRAAVKSTNVPCVENDGGTDNPYSAMEHTSVDKIFLPSMYELNGGAGSEKYVQKNSLEKIWPYFLGADNTSREAQLVGDVSSYWLRSPVAFYPNENVSASNLRYIANGSFSTAEAIKNTVGLRPAVNISGDISVSISPNGDGVHEILWATSIRYGHVLGNNDISVADAIVILRHIVGLTDLKNTELYNEGAYERAKVSGGDSLTVSDAILILRKIVGLIDYGDFPVNQ